MKVKLKAELVREVLARKNLSQNWLAQKLETSTGYMSQLMTGIRNPSPEMRDKILELNIFKGYGFDDLFLLDSKCSGDEQEPEAAA